MSKPAAIFRQGQAQPRTHSFFTSTPYGGQQNAPFGGGVGQPATTGYGGQQNAWPAAPSGGFSPGNYANMSPAARPAPFQQTMQTPWGQMDPNQYYQQQQSFVQAAVNQHGQAARNAGTYGAANMPAGAPPSYDPAQLWNTASQMPTSGGMWGNPPTAYSTLEPDVAIPRLPWSGWPDGMQNQPPPPRPVPAQQRRRLESPWIAIPDEMQNQPPPPSPPPAQQRSPGVQTNGVGRMRAGSPTPAASARTDDSYQRDWIAMQAQQYRAIGVRNPLAEARRAWNEAPAAADGRRVMVNPNNPWSSKFPDIDPWRALDRRR